ncbi:hypothetical protein BGZ49_003605 [Haplosporangium sp. Z 27]|nr:hypothetical protein BGZ49_003605 [Haplosporangium sp. Z 27]
MEEDFPFSFGNVSDEDKGSEGLFCAPKIKTTSSKPKATIDQDPYYAQIDEDGWFHNTGKSIVLMMQEKNGATKVKMRADHYYMLHQYQEAYDIAQEYCHIVASNGVNNEEGESTGLGLLKVTDSKEMHEMALRCALKLNMPDEAARLADELTIQDIGAVFLKAKAYMAVGRYNDAALKLVQYQKTRSSNYSIWRALGECLHQSSMAPNSLLEASSISASEPTRTTVLALISILRARHLMRASTWSQVDYAQARYERELKAMNDQISTLERECGLNLNNITDQSKNQGHSLQEDTEYLFKLEEYTQKIVTPAQETLQTMKEVGKVKFSQIHDSFAIEVVEFVVSSWDPQVLASSTRGFEMEYDNEPNEVS